MRGPPIILLAVSAITSACAVPLGMQNTTGPSAGETVTGLPLPGYGTLRQEEVSIALTSGDLRLLVTPLEESVTLVTAPDTYRRLSTLAAAHQVTAGVGATLFLVQFFSERPDVRFVPEEVQLVSRSLRVRPSRIIPVTPTWGERRLKQRETEMAVYAFEAGIDLESDLTLVYGLNQTTAWNVILTRVQAERARARARGRF